MISGKTIYKCMLCNKESSQKSHHTKHLNTEKHKSAEKILKLELCNLTIDELNKTYNETDICEIISRQSNMEIACSASKTEDKGVVLYTVPNSTKTSQKYKLENKLVWTIDKLKKADDKKYLTYKYKLDNIIKRCHDTLYSHGAVTGDKARDDIMRLLTLKILQYELKKEDSVLWKKCNLSETKYKKYKSYCLDISLLYKSESFKNQWKMLVEKFLSQITDIYSISDAIFNCTEDIGLHKITEIIDELDVNEDFINSYGTSCGDIHEMFASYGGKASSKALGAFYTPRKLIDLILEALGIRDMIKDSDDIYDPCMGTGGFLTRAHKQIKDKNFNIYGCELSLDTFKFAHASILLTTGKVNKNLERCDSLCQSKTLIDKKYDGILTNPPFGTVQTYGKIDKKTKKETGLLSDFNEKFPDSEIKFTDIYPIKCNNGACLFVQNCVYKLKEGGFCAVVLPDGELFEGMSKWSIKFRKWWCQNVNITKILKVPCGTFDHAGVKTNVVVFEKTGSTKQIKFFETTKKCDSLTYLATITKADLEANNYSLDLNDYLEEEVDYEYESSIEKLGDICEFISGPKKNSKLGKDSGKYPLFYCSILKCKYLDTFDYDGEGLIINTTNGSGKCKINYINGKYNVGNSTFHFKSKNNNILTKYLYLYFKFNINLITNNFKGIDKKSITKGRLEKIKIPIPSLQIQLQIIERLSKIEYNISTIEQRILQQEEEIDFYKEFGSKKNIKNLLKGVDKVKLDEIVTCKRGNLGKPNSDESKNIYPYYSAKSISGYLDSYEFSGPSVMLNYRVNTKCKNYSICQFIKSGKYNCSRFSWVLKLKDESIIVDYLYHFLENCVDYTPLIKGSIPEINSTNLKNKIKIPIPSIEIQKELIKIFEQKEQKIQEIRDDIVNKKKYITELNELAKDIIRVYC